MLNVCFSPYLFLRTPALSYNDYNSSMLEEILGSQFFQAAIFFASESLYTELSCCGFNYHLLDKKVRLSLQKYFNRMCYRPTPFGMFSAFSSLYWDNLENKGDCILDDKRYIHINPDFQFTINMAKKMLKSTSFSNVKYYTNNAIYSIKGEKRYLTNAFDADSKKNDFLISSYKANRLLNKLMNFCKEGRTKTEIVTWLANLTADEGDTKEYITDLIEAGLLVSELYPNMIGEKYFNRLAGIAAANTNDKFAADILAYEYLINNIKQGCDIDIEQLTSSNLYSNYDKKLKSMFYVGYERVTQSLIDKKYQEYIKDGLNCLNKLTFGGTTKSLVTFKSKFKARFEDQEIPVLLALDREAGIGYEGLEANLATSELLDGIQLDLQSNSLNFSWTPVHEFFLTKLSQNKNDDCISISDRDLEKFQSQSELKCPPSFSVLFRIFGDKIWLEQAGGCTSAAILGRFTLFSDRVLEEARYVAAMEEQINKEVIFAEISCFNDQHAANINSSAGIRAYEIPIGVHSTLKRENIIDLSDITVSIINDTIVLRSRKLNKTIIPRLSSAYNYGRSELSVFRFLCDLQHQGLKSNFNLDLKSLLPGLNFYPRVEYRNCILFPATWILRSDEIAEIVQGKDTNFNFQKMSEKIRLQKHFALTEGDNQLIFDRDAAESIALFVTVIKNKSSVILQEAFLDQSAFVKDQSGKPFAGQFAASVYSNDITYQLNGLEPLHRKNNKVKRVYLPGDEWIYLKLYCHSAISNNILTKDIINLVTWLKKQHILKSWYFIRYADPDNHLRVRVQINPNDATEVLKYFEKKIRHQVEKGSVNNLLLDTYKREIERYGENTIEYVEKVFQVSSELVLAYLKKVPDGYSELQLAIISVNSILEIFFHQNSERIALLKGIHESMKHEFDDSKQVKFQLDNKYREYSFFINNMQVNTSVISVITGKKEFNNYLKTLQLLKLNAAHLTTEKLLKLVADLMHMHLNRLFNEKQRKQEFIIYYLLYKYYISIEARKGKVTLVLPPAPQGHRIDHVNEAVFK